MDGIVTVNMVTISSTTYLVVSKRVSFQVAFGARVGTVVEGDTQPVAETGAEFSIEEVEAERGGGDHIDPVKGMGEGGGES